MNIRFVVLSVISGTPTKKFSQKKPTAVLAKDQEKQITWNDGTILYVNLMLATSARLCLSQKMISITRLLLAFILFATTYHLFINHYHKKISEIARIFFI